MENRERPSVRLGRLSGDHIVFRVLGRMHDSDDYWDGNWLVVPLDISVGGFRGAIDAALRAEELRSFREGLQRIYNSMHGQAELRSMEDWLAISIVFEPSGKLKIRGRVRDRLGEGNELAFRIDDLDQSDLPPTITALEEVEALFPVVGSP